MTFFSCILRKITNTAQCIVMKSCFTLFRKRYFLFYVLRCNNTTLKRRSCTDTTPDPTAIYHAVKVAKSVADPRSIMNRAINFRKTLEEARFSRKKTSSRCQEHIFPPHPPPYSFQFHNFLVVFWRQKSPSNVSAFCSVWLVIKWIFDEEARRLKVSLFQGEKRLECSSYANSYLQKKERKNWIRFSELYLLLAYLFSSESFISVNLNIIAQSPKCFMFQCKTGQIVLIDQNVSEFILY